MDANEDQQPAAEHISNDEQLFVSPARNDTPIKNEPVDTPWNFKLGEEINLLSDDEGNDDISGAFTTRGSPFKPRRKVPPTGDSAIPTPEKAPDIQKPDSKSTPLVLASDKENAAKLRQLMLQKQRQMVEKFREREPAVADSNSAPSDGEDDDVEQTCSKGATAAKFEQQRREIAFMKAKSAESARLRKLEADEKFDREATSDDDDEEGLFVKDAFTAPSYADLYSDDDEPEKPKKPSKKRPIQEDSEDEQSHGRRKQKSVSRKSLKVPGTRYTDQDLKNVLDKAKKQKTNGGKCKKTEPNMTNLKSIWGSNIFDDTAAVSALPSQPKFEQEGGRRATALTKLIASVPTESKKIASVDKKYLDAAVSDFTGKGSVAPAADGNWSVKGMRSTLKHYQVLGTAFMRKRETTTQIPNGGILADEMGLGKTIMMLANVVNGRPKKGKPKATLIVASPALVREMVTQWADEIRTHCDSQRDNKLHGLGKVLQHRAGKRVVMNDKDDTREVLEGADVVLTTWSEVRSSYPTADIPADLTTGPQKDAWWKEHYEKNCGVLHRIQWLRVVLDEAHNIKNHKSQVSLACRALQSAHYWCITGTPIQNTIKEFYPYFKLIREEHTGSYRQFKENFASPDDPDGTEKLNAFLRVLMIRRTHLDTLFNARLLDLPKPREHTIWVEFSEIEREIYEIVKKRFIQRINTISKQNGLEKQYSHIWTMILRLRQICSHVLLVQGTVIDLLERDDLEKLASLTQDEDDMNDEGAALLVHLRNVLKSNIGVKTIEGGIGDSILTESETLPTGVIGLDDTEGVTGGKHGLSYRFKKYLDALANSEHFDVISQRTICSGCRQPPQEPQVTSCFHVFCLACLKDLQHLAARRGHDQARCSECGTAYTSTQPCMGIDKFHSRATSTSTVEAKATKKGKKIESKLDWIGLKGEVLPSAKTRAVKAQILNYFESDPEVKIIVYSLFLDMIRILSKICATEGWGFCRYTGTMSQDSREKSIREFNGSKEKKILLASLKCGGLGLNLVCASRVILLDPWFNRSVEDQAFARVFRIGQTKSCQMLRVVVKNSIDAALMAMKERKQVEIDAVMESKDKLTVEDLMRLFGDVGEDGEGRPFIFPSKDETEPEHLRLANVDDEDEERFIGHEA